MKNLSLKDRFIIRKPLLSIDELITLQNKLLENGEQYLVTAMRDKFSNSLFQQAIYTASIDLHQELIKWLNTEEKHTDYDLKMANSLYKYFIRMCSRSTPYGLFSGCTTGAFSTSENHFFVDAESHRKCSRLDMNYIAEIASYISHDKTIRPHLTYKPNTSIYRIGGNIRFVEYQLKNKKRTYSTSMIKENIFVDMILERAKHGGSICELGAALEADVSPSEAAEFVEKLIDNQILVSDLEPLITGEFFFDALIGKLAKIPAAKRYLTFLREVKDTLDYESRSVTDYQNLHAKILKHFPNTTGKDLIQTDVFYDQARVHIDQQLKDSLTQQVTQLLRVNNKVKNEDLERFKASFYSRYETREVPLSVALDSETGIGYGLSAKRVSNHMPLLNDLTLPATKGSAPLEWTERNKFLFRKIQQAKKQGYSVIHITDEDIQQLIDKDLHQVEFPSSMQVFGSLMAENEGQISGNNFLFSLTSLGGNSSSNTLARFGLGSSEIASELASTCRHEESQTDKLIAEIVHLPQSRMGNILIRPNTFSYEIPYLGQSSVAEEFQIPLSDLMISVRSGRAILRSKRLNREILPSLTTAHSFSRGLPVYKFLCDLQMQNMYQPYAWISAFDQQEIHIPRVQYKNIILRKQQWNLQKKHFEGSLNTIDALAAFRTDFNVPRFVLLAQGDNELLIDFESRNSLEILISYIKKSDITLVEFLQTPQHCVLSDKQGNKYCNEIIFSLLSKKESPVTSIQNAPKETVAKRTYNVGSEWLYIKLYTGTKTADKILTAVIRPFCKELIASKTIDKWFFLRFSDPQEHLRIRFHSKDSGFWSQVLQQFNQLAEPLLSSGEIYKIQLDTYEQEIERYGSKTMQVSESLFYHDSVAVSKFLSLIAGSEGEKFRWLFALRGIDMLMEDFCLDITEKYDVINTMARSYFEEFNGDDLLKHNLNQKYRQNREAIENILNPDKDAIYITKGVACFSIRSEMNRMVLENTSLSINQKKDLLLSYIHMFAIRLFIAEPRMQELVIYHYLAKYYESHLARTRRGKKELLLA
ncbi:hypothetical protein DSL64_03545 [Dyadobacter luteus]|uniref:Lantibiotic dehydratase n=1 Tax=Dyadobacter luteus TaxID=2259619 RepID=A0A3D8YIM2_9BACT|nr:lantibiotic dehydratase [Dyadobacter luteus]REA63530.1 hypothetical protein DSL64_03545 [Dyadobacter luteus]